MVGRTLFDSWWGFSLRSVLFHQDGELASVVSGLEPVVLIPVTRESCAIASRYDFRASAVKPNHANRWMPRSGIDMLPEVRLVRL